MVQKIKKYAISIVVVGIISLCMLGFMIPQQKGGAPIAWNYMKFLVKEVISPKSLEEKLALIKLQTEVVGTEVLMKESFVNLNTMFRYYTGTRVFEQAERDIAVLENDYLCFLNKVTYVPYEDTHQFDELAKYLEEQQVPLLYVQAPYKLEAGNEKLPNQETDIMNDVADEFLRSIEDSVPYIDLREEIKSQGMNHYDLFFKTDHHWIPETGLWATKQIANTLREAYGFEMDEHLFDLDHYKTEYYPNSLLGSEGRQVGEFLVGLDDFTLIYPDFDTNLSVDIPAKQINQTGTFQEALLDYAHVESKDLYNNSPYDTYLAAMTPYMSIVNNNAPNDKKILLVRDSFSTVVAPFLALGCEQLDVLDLRDFREPSLVEYIEETKPDIVIFMYYPCSIYMNATDFGVPQ